jgi:murein DD-endopeptidase MepM/ murein hydrolase activator NlpD
MRLMVTGRLNQKADLKILAALIILLILAPGYGKLPAGDAATFFDNGPLLAQSGLDRLQLLKGFPAHRVAAGQTLYQISRFYHVSIKQLAELNQLQNPARIYSGRKLYLPAADPADPGLLRYTVENTVSVAALCGKYGLTREQFRRLNPGVEAPLLPGTKLLLPKRIPPRSIQKPAPAFGRPVRGRISSRFGWRWGRMHYGLDLAAPAGTPVLAAAGGRVIFSGWQDGYGLLVKLQHGDYRTYYGHLSRSLVRPGQVVAKGALIGRVGATGNARGSHLHFEVEKRGQKVNPSEYIK